MYTHGRSVCLTCVLISDEYTKVLSVLCGVGGIVLYTVGGQGFLWAGPLLVGILALYKHWQGGSVALNIHTYTMGVESTKYTHLLTGVWRALNIHQHSYPGVWREGNCHLGIDEGVNLLRILQYIIVSKSSIVLEITDFTYAS